MTELIARIDRRICELKTRVDSFVDVGRRAARDSHGRASSRFGRRAKDLTETAELLGEIRTVLLDRCSGCGGPHPFDTSVPSVRWNAVIRAHDMPEYLCLTCIVSAFAKAGESLTATLWGEPFHGLPIEIRINSLDAVDAAKISDENTRLRVRIRELEGGLQ